MDDLTHALGRYRLARHIAQVRHEQFVHTLGRPDLDSRAAGERLARAEARAHARRWDWWVALVVARQGSITLAEIEHAFPLSFSA